MIERLTREHPNQFHFAGGALACALTGERLRFGPDGSGVLAGVEPAGTVQPPYASALDALASQVQEDLALVSTAPANDGTTRHWLSAVHLCFPNHWAAEDKIGRAFAAIHEPVAGMEQMNRQGDQLVSVMVGATEGLVRFAWGVTFDDKLNHHPQAPPGAGRADVFDPVRPRAFLRVERQTVWGFPDVGAALFTIRTYLHDVAVIRRDPVRRAKLAAAVRSMSAASLAYKGLAGSHERLAGWVEADGER
jgi:hypothetical protein